MSMDCRACGDLVPDGLFMKCSKKQCMKVYDIKCLGIAEEEFHSFSKERKLEWICPECVCSKPKRNYPDTPVRSSFQMETDETSAYVNTQRGSRLKPTADVSIVECDHDSVLLSEFRQFRLEVLQRLDMQAKLFKHLQEVCYSTKTELEELKENMKVFQENIPQQNLFNSNQPGRSMKGTSNCSKSGAEATNQTPIPTSFAVVARSDYKVKKQNTTSTRVTSQTTEAPKTASVTVSVAESPTISQPIKSTQTFLHSEFNSREDKNEENGWTTVRRNKGNLKSKNVQRGRNSDLVEIQATEKKKHLHVWRLAVDTTVEKLTSHVKGVCGSEVNVKSTSKPIQE